MFEYSVAPVYLFIYVQNTTDSTMGIKISKILGRLNFTTSVMLNDIGSKTV